MKKVIIAILLMIPLIVILTISVSGRIISAEVAIGIESIELWHKGEQVSEATVNYGEYTRKKLRYQLKTKYFPSVAQVTGFRWYSDNEAVATVDGDGIVTFRDVGFAKVTAESLDSSSVKASCSFFVEDDAIHSIRFYSYETGAEVTSFTTEVYRSEQFRVEISPYNALASEPIFSSSDDSVFTCDENGILTTKKEGRADFIVTAKSLDGSEKSVTLPVTVSGTALLKQEKVYVYGDESFDLSPYIASGAVSGGNEIEISSLSYGVPTTYRVTDGSRSADLVVERLPYERMLGIKGMDLLREWEWKNGVYTAVGRVLNVTIVDMRTGEKADGVTVTSSDPALMRQENGKIKAMAAGKVTLTFSKEGYEPVSLEVTTATPVSYFSLNFDSDDDVVGLGSRRVFGTRSVYDGVIREGVRVIPQNIYPAACDLSLFTYSVDQDYAHIDEDGLLIFEEDAVGKPLTVTVKSLFSTNAMSRTYTFENVVKGINVGFGFGANAYDADNDIKPSFVPYYDALKTLSEDRTYAIVFQTNLYLPSREELDGYQGPYAKISLTRDVYGNGYKLDGQFYQYDYESHVFEGTSDDQLEPWQKGITIVDLIINSYAPVGGDSKETFEALMVKGGEPIRSFYKERKDFKITFRYCVFQYSYSHACLIGGTFEFDGCIFRNSAGVSIMIQSLHGQENYVTINNCIFSNSISMAGIVSNGTFPAEKDEELRYNEVRWTGDNYIYNWKKTDEVKLDIIPKGLMKNETLDILLDAVNNKLTECARNSFRGGMNGDLIVHYGEEDYVNMGFLFINFWSPDKTILNGTREKVTDGLKVDYDTKSSSFIRMELNTVALGTVKNATKRFLDLEAPTYFLTNRTEEGDYTTAPEETYKLNESTFARIRGQGKK